jgi:hypothetical protein
MLDALEAGMFASPLGRFIRMLVPAVYFGGLFYYFYNQAGSWENAQTFGLGPTLVGLACVGLLLSMPLLIGIVQIILTRIRIGARAPRDGGPSDPNDSGGFDADAVIARYMARQAGETAKDAQRPSPTRGTSNTSSFGRKRQ